MPNPTILKFKYPDSLLHEYENWVVLLRPQQVTAGSMVLACKLDANAMSEVPAPAFAELAKVTADLEGTLRSVFSYDKINYLLLMMVDREVHFHVLPRYSSPRDVFGVEFIDTSWPRPPDLTRVVDVTSDQYNKLLAELRANWPR